MVITIGVSSCNKQSDDLKLPVENYTNGPDSQVAGVTALVTNIFTLRSAITSLQTTIVALPETSSIAALKTGLSAISVKIDGIYFILNTMATSGTASKALIEVLKADLAALPSKVAADINALKVQIAAIGASNDVQVSKLNELITVANALTVSITAAQKSLNNITDFQGLNAAPVAVAALAVQMNAAKVSFDILLTTYLP